jgi:hypothetical protein
MANALVPQGSGGLGVPERLYRSNSDSKLRGKPDKELVTLGPPLRYGADTNSLGWYRVFNEKALYAWADIVTNEKVL